MASVFVCECFRMRVFSYGLVLRFRFFSGTPDNRATLTLIDASAHNARPHVTIPWSPSPRSLLGWQYALCYLFFAHSLTCWTGHSTGHVSQSLEAWKVFSSWVPSALPAEGTGTKYSAAHSHPKSPASGLNLGCSSPSAQS